MTRAIIRNDNITSDHRGIRIVDWTEYYRNVTWT